MSLPSSMYMMMSPLGMYVLFGMRIKLIKKEDSNVHSGLSDRSVPVLPVCPDDVDRGQR